jgi:hypothetical protein
MLLPHLRLYFEIDLPIGTYQRLDAFAAFAA